MKKTIFAVLAATFLALIFAVAVPTRAQEEEKPRQDNKQVQEDKTRPEKQEDKNAQRDDKRVEPAQADRNDRREEKHEQHGHIPDDRFRANFGRAHAFVINRPVIVEGTPRFQYSGYWFVIAEPWPVGWAYTDQVFVDYIDGEYFLFSPIHPGVRVSINVVF
jgi:hypothetical protein